MSTFSAGSALGSRRRSGCATRTASRSSSSAGPSAAGAAVPRRGRAGAVDRGVAVAVPLADAGRWRPVAVLAGPRPGGEEPDAPAARVRAADAGRAGRMGPGAGRGVKRGKEATMTITAMTVTTRPHRRVGRRSACSGRPPKASPRRTATRTRCAATRRPTWRRCAPVPPSWRCGPGRGPGGARGAVCGSCSRRSRRSWGVGRVLRVLLRYAGGGGGRHRPAGRAARGRRPAPAGRAVRRAGGKVVLGR